MPKIYELVLTGDTRDGFKLELACKLEIILFLIMLINLFFFLVRKKVAAREKQQITHKGIPIRITADLSIETLQARREWQNILKVMKEKNLQTRLLFQHGSHSDMKEKSKVLQTS